MNIKLSQSDLWELERLGNGVIGVISAVNEGTVIKWCPSSNKDGKKVFEREREVYRFLRGLEEKSKYVLACFDPDNAQGLLLERCDENLFQRLQRGLLSSTELRIWAKQIAEGLRFLHERRIVHSDLRCENVLLKGGIVKLCDFGGSRLGDLPRLVSRPFDPWVAVPREEDSPKADIWAMGSVLYEMATGKRPTRSRWGCLNTKWQRPSMRGISKWVRVIIDKCWSLEYTSAAEIVTDIERATPRSKLELG